MIKVCTTYSYTTFLLIQKKKKKKSKPQKVQSWQYKFLPKSFNRYTYIYIYTCINSTPIHEKRNRFLCTHAYHKIKKKKCYLELHKGRVNKKKKISKWKICLAHVTDSQLQLHPYLVGVIFTSTSMYNPLKSRTHKHKNLTFGKQRVIERKSAITEN